jgi:hypothetical protein
VDKETIMMRLFVFVLLPIFSLGSLMAAENSQTFYLATAVRAGNAQVPRGICEVSWKTVSGSRVLLTLKTEDDKTVTVSARMVEGKQETTGAVTSVINGITYLQELHTKNAKFVIQNRMEGSK